MSAVVTADMEALFDHLVDGHEQARWPFFCATIPKCLLAETVRARSGLSRAPEEQWFACSPYSI